MKRTCQAFIIDLVVMMIMIMINTNTVFIPGGTPLMKGVGMLVVSLRGINFGFWSHLGCSGKNAIIFSREGLV